jgi:hypothetical protein
MLPFPWFSMGNGYSHVGLRDVWLILVRLTQVLVD